MGSLTLRLSDTLEKKLQKASKQRGVSKSDFAREALERFMRIHTLQNIRDKVSVQLDKLGIYTEEEVLKKIRVLEKLPKTKDP